MILIKRILRTIKHTLILFFTIYILVSGFLYFNQYQILYPEPSQLPYKSLPDFAKKIDFLNSHGYLLIPKYHTQLAPSNPVPLVFFIHGNAELADFWLYEFSQLLENNIAVFLFEYPGYGNSHVSTNKTSITESVLDAYDKVLANETIKINSDRIIVYGRSIGGGIASLLAEKKPVSALFLESTFSSLSRLVYEKGWPGFLVKDKFDNLSIIKQLALPIIIFHGNKDKLIPVSHARRLQKAAAEYASIHEDSCGHNDCPRRWDIVAEFMCIGF